MSALLVEVPAFSGPLDLLLTLIQKRRLDVTAVSLAAVADQYLEQVLALDRQLEPLSEFLVLGSQLLLIKSRALLPVVEPEREGEELVYDLQRRLAEYQVLQAAARWLEEREASGLRSWPRGAELALPTNGDAPLAPVAPDRLLRLYLLCVGPRAGGDGVALAPLSERPTLRARVDAVLAGVCREAWRPVAPLLGRDVSTAVATFLALLILVRYAIVEVRQEAPYGLLEARRGPGDPAILPDPDAAL